MTKERKVIKEENDSLHFILPIKLVPAQDGVSNTPAIKQEAEEVEPEEVKTEDEFGTDPVAEADDELDALPMEEAEEEVAPSEELKTESDDEELKTEADEEELPVEEEEEAEPEKELKLSEELGDLNLEQDVKDKIDTAFDTIVKEKVARIREELEKDAEKEIAESVKKLKEQVGLYCERVARSFVENNKMAIKESLRLKYFESFFGKVRKLFKENYVDLPEAEEDLAKELKSENEELKDKTDELLKDNEKLAESVIRLQRVAKIDKVASNMFLTESERFKVATEQLLTQKLSGERFDAKLKAISELFANKSTPKKKLLSEGKIEKKVVLTEGKEQIHPDVKAILGDWSA